MTNSTQPPQDNEPKLLACPICKEEPYWRGNIRLGVCVYVKCGGHKSKISHEVRTGFFDSLEAAANEWNTFPRAPIAAPAQGDEIDRLRAALRFYYEAFEQRLETCCDGHTVIYVPSDKLKKDCGNIARHALGISNPSATPKPNQPEDV